jgi:alpha-1,2-mannosyltransferase
MDSLPPVIKRHWPLAAAAVLFGLYGWALVAATGLGHDGAIGPRFNALGADWVIFLAAARAVFTGDLSHIYNQAWITGATNSQFSHWLSQPLPFPLFPYPPVFLLLVLPFATLSVGWSLLASQLVQFAALALALRRLGGPTLFLLLGAWLAPAASNNVLAGSNAVLVAALIVGGVALLETRPLLAGALLGLVIFKPQFFVLLPFVLIAGRQGRALAGMIACALALVLVSAALFGPSLWLDWINVYLHPQAMAGISGTDWGHSWDDSVSTCVTLLGPPHGVALVAQALAGLAGLVASWRAFRTNHPQRLAILLCAALLASPHVSNYDLILAAIAALLLLRTMPESSRPLALMLPLAGFIAPLYNPPRALPLGLITPLVLLGLIWALLREKPVQNPLSVRV